MEEMEEMEEMEGRGEKEAISIYAVWWMWMWLCEIYLGLPLLSRNNKL
jgi:hypothetical protein